MITYASAHCQKPFNWNKFLDSEHISDTAWHEAYFLSSKWVTCACGNLCELIPREDNIFQSGGSGMPEDRKLRNLGVRFNENILSKNQKRAKITLDLIEKRSAEILYKMRYA